MNNFEMNYYLNKYYYYLNYYNLY